MADIIVCKPQLCLESMTSDHRALVVQSTVEFELVDPASNASICPKHNCCNVTHSSERLQQNEIGTSGGRRERSPFMRLTIAERSAQPSFCMPGRALNGMGEVLISYDFIIIV